MSGLKNKRVSTAFHHTIPLSLPSVSGILELAVSKNGKVSEEDIKENLHLGNNYIKAMPSYARASGLLQFAGFKATTLGVTLLDKDPDLLDISSLWIMHYHLSAPHGPGPLFWNHAVTNLLKAGDRIESSKLGKQIAEFILDTTGEPLQERTTSDSATIFLRSYSKSDALGPLGIAIEAENSYLIDEPEPPSAWVIGYALADYWESAFGERKGINLSEITSVDGFLNIFWMGSGAFLSKLSELQQEGYLQLQRVAPPHQLVRFWENKEVFLEKIYA